MGSPSHWYGPNPVDAQEFQDRAQALEEGLGTNKITTGAYAAGLLAILDAIADLGSALDAQNPYLSRIATAVESIDSKTKPK